MSLAQRYATTQNETASKERLMVLLFEAALRHIRTAATALEAKRYQDAARSRVRQSSRSCWPRWIGRRPRSCARSCPSSTNS